MKSFSRMFTRDNVTSVRKVNPFSPTNLPDGQHHDHNLVDANEEGHHNKYSVQEDDIEHQIKPTPFSSFDPNENKNNNYPVVSKIILRSNRLRNEYKIFQKEDQYPFINLCGLLVFHVLAFIYCFWENICLSMSMTPFHIVVAIFWMFPLSFCILLLINYKHLKSNIRRSSLLAPELDPINSGDSSCKSNLTTYANQYPLFQTQTKFGRNRAIRNCEIGLIISSSLCISLHLVAQSIAAIYFDKSISPEIIMGEIYFTLISPLFISTSFRGMNWEYSCISEFLAISFCIISVGISQNVVFIPNIFMGSCFVLATFFEGRRRSIHRFLMIRDQKHLMSEQLKQLYDKSSDLKVADARTEGMKYSIANIVHDLKTPLSSFQITLDELKASLQASKSLSELSVISTPSRRPLLTTTTNISCSPTAFDFNGSLELLHHLTNTCQIMFMTINRSLDFTKVSSGIMLVPNYESIHLEQALDVPISCMRCLQTRIPVLVKPFSGICPMIITDKTWFHENILCLVSNAVKYSDEGNITVYLHLVNDSEKELTYLCVEVEDTGIGLSEEAKSKLFQPFNQAQRMAGGTGLGLFSLLQRMLALNGSCGVKNRSDGLQGSVFWFQFPYKPDAEAAAELDTLSRSGDSSNSLASIMRPWASADNFSQWNMKLRSLRVLVVDDSLVILRIMVKALTRYGHVVESAENGAIALRMFESAQVPYDVILTDLQMPVMDGYEFCKRVRHFEYRSNRNLDIQILGEDEDYQEVRRHQVMIGMSANNAEDTQKDSRSAGMDNFITKPFNVDDLVQLLLKYPSFRAHDRAIETGLLHDLGLFEYSEGIMG